MDPTPTPTHVVRVELVRLSGRATGGSTAGGPQELAYRVESALLAGGTPDEAARGLCPQDVDVVHSTSWRTDDDGAVVLTYAALPCDDVDQVATPLLAPSVVCSGDPLVPTPPQVHAHHVAAHAVRHLAYLLGTDPGIAAAAASSRRPGLWEAVRRTAATTPTGTHEAVHRAAARQPGAASPVVPGVPVTPGASTAPGVSSVASSNENPSRRNSSRQTSTQSRS